MTQHTKAELTKTFDKWGDKVGQSLYVMGTLHPEVHALLEEWLELNVEPLYGVD